MTLAVGGGFADVTVASMFSTWPRPDPDVVDGNEVRDPLTPTVYTGDVRRTYADGHASDGASVLAVQMLRSVNRMRRRRSRRRVNTQPSPAQGTEAPMPSSSVMLPPPPLVWPSAVPEPTGTSMVLWRLCSRYTLEYDRLSIVTGLGCFFSDQC